MSQPFITFLTTAYCTERYLAEAIESVRAQTHADWQLVIVDNGNADLIAVIAERYLHDRRIVLIRQENKGYRGGVAAALQAATGRFISVLDSDDLLAPTFVQRIGEVVGSDPSIGAVGCDAELFYDPEHHRRPEAYFASIGRQHPPDERSRAGFHELMREGVPCYTGAIRRDLWDQFGGFDPVEHDVEPDVVLWLRMAAAGVDIRILPQVLVKLRQRPMSESRHPEKIGQFEHRLQKSFIVVGHEAGMTTDQIARTGMLRRLRYQCALRRAREAFLQGQIDVSRQFARSAFEQRHTLRATLILTGLQLSPALLSAVHPIKKRTAELLRQHGVGVPPGRRR